MTKEEAKDFLIGISYKLGNMAIEYLTEKDGEKMREAIEVLEQEPNCPFYIIDDDGHGVCTNNPIKPKTGHWIANTPQYDMLNPQYICSECGNAHTRTTPYCEMCGAKMIESEES